MNGRTPWTWLNSRRPMKPIGLSVLLTALLPLPGGAPEAPSAEDRLDLCESGCCAPVVERTSSGGVVGPLGDVNDDGDVNLTDALELAQFLAGPEGPMLKVDGRRLPAEYAPFLQVEPKRIKECWATLTGLLKLLAARNAGCDGVKCSLQRFPIGSIQYNLGDAHAFPRRNFLVLEDVYQNFPRFWYKISK